MGQHTTTVTSKGQVTIPGELRRALGIKPKDRIAFELVEGEIRLRPAKSVVEATYGVVKPISRPEDFQELRRDFKEGVAEEVRGEG
ncbi:MAG: AbrB/MazE/SpoVT family DNA-binding domain-containing protein [Dehalococcoidia bacterium]|nr:AbrB/MazE/SpoVT family DNA-binding domain-containing protein [Dehalococcoidia bacterium]